MNAGDSNNVAPRAAAAAAARRRETILADALRAADRRRRARVVRSVAGAACACVMAFVAIAIVNRATRQPVPRAPLVKFTPGPSTVAAPTPRPSTSPDAPPHIVVQIIPADLVERRWQVIDDDQLISALAAAGQPGGVVRLNGRAVVVPLR